MLRKFSSATAAVSSTIWLSSRRARRRANSSSLTRWPVIVMASAYSKAARSSGEKCRLSRQVGTSANASGNSVVPGGIEAETRQLMTNIKDVLEKSGSDMDHVVKCTVFMADMKEWDAMNGVYKTFFRNNKYPARSAFGSTGLALNARVEIECIATVK